MRRLFAAALLLLAAAGAAADSHTDYLLYCRGCHLANGRGVPPAVPSLHELAPLLGSADGRDYIVRVPGVSQTPLSNARLAAVLNWIVAEFNAVPPAANVRPFTAREVAQSRRKVLNDPLRERSKILGD